MPRRRQESVLDDTFDLLKVMPIWVGPILAVVVFILFRFVFPSFIPAKNGGVNTGALFWGCSTYPGCKGTRQVEAVGT